MMSTLERRPGGDPAQIATNRPKEWFVSGKSLAESRTVVPMKFKLYDLKAFLRTLIVFLAIFGLLLVTAAAKVNGV
jgi:hypothetical protein